MNSNTDKIVFIDKITKAIYDQLINHILYSKSFDEYKEEYIEKHNKQKPKEEILQSEDFITFTFIIMSIKTDFNTEFSYNNYKFLYDRIINKIYIHVLHFSDLKSMSIKNNINIVNEDLTESLISIIKKYYIKEKEDELKKGFYIQLKKLIKSFNSISVNQEINNKITGILNES